jgi:hypothetical protein
MRTEYTTYLPGVFIWSYQLYLFLSLQYIINMVVNINYMYNNDTQWRDLSIPVCTPDTQVLFLSGACMLHMQHSAVQAHPGQSIDSQSSLPPTNSII